LNIGLQLLLFSDLILLFFRIDLPYSYTLLCQICDEGFGEIDDGVHISFVNDVGGGMDVSGGGGNYGRVTAS